ncbi:hypothetical protein KDL01_29855 [Actinospica durhamensis]|uniref:Hemerythrin-like domain-containing protein n=1 Tax=Actinospica durhamensis TaxID=1508375 RepID=A0A941ITE2_9ACTN|nr:hypothetical protein [Actinospica durhamensis]MBR7837522.1 hypothetical protein [Actinospica durhamensis]
MVRTPEAAAELAREHDEIDRLATLVSTLGAGPARRAIVLEICGRYAVHAEVEARYLMPAVQRYLPDGARAVADEAGRHQAVIQTMAAYLRLCEPATDAPAPANDAPADAVPPAEADAQTDASAVFDQAEELDILVGQLVAGIQSHVEQQDAVLLAQLNRVCPLTESMRLGGQLRDAMAAARAAVEVAGGIKDLESEVIEAQARAEGRPRPHRIRALFRQMWHGLWAHPGQPAGTS